MHKWYLCSLFLALPIGMVCAEEVGDASQNNLTTYFQTDFSDGIDPGFATYDLDQQTLHFTMTQAGFKQGDAFAAIREKRVAKENFFAGSTSKYKYAEGEEHQPSNDWLVTPQIWIRGEHAVLNWRAKSICNSSKNTSGYKVYVSTTGNRPEDFTAAPIFTVEAESASQWVNHEVSLADYAGKKVYIAFQNDNMDKEILGLDDLKVSGEKGLCDLVVKTPAYTFGQQEVKVDCSLTAFSDEPVTDVTAYYECGGKVYTRQLSGLSLQKYETVDFSFDEVIPAPYGDTLRYAVWAEVNQRVTLEKQACQTISFLFQPQRKTVVEEGTGMWCGYCPKGIVAMDILEEKYPDEYIGIALHYDDPMEVRDYREAMNFPSFPSGWFNRKYLSVDPMVVIEENGVEQYSSLYGGFETLFLQAQAEQTLADLSVTTAEENGQLKATAQLRFAVDRNDAHYQVAFVVVEDSVQDKTYYQTNYFSGMQPALGGYEKLPPRIINPVFNHVARGVYDDYRGIPGSVPAQLVAGETYTFAYVIPMPETVKDMARVKIVALLIDTQTGEVVNANIAASCVTGIEDLVQRTAGLSAEKQGCRLDVAASAVSSAPMVFRVYNMAGACIAQKQGVARDGRAEATFSLENVKGVLVVTATQGGQTQAMKLKF